MPVIACTKAAIFGSIFGGIPGGDPPPPDPPDPPDPVPPDPPDPVPPDPPDPVPPDPVPPDPVPPDPPTGSVLATCVVTISTLGCVEAVCVAIVWATFLTGICVAYCIWGTG